MSGTDERIGMSREKYLRVLLEARAAADEEIREYCRRHGLDGRPEDFASSCQIPESDLDDYIINS